jgi:hypothetical protein
MPIRLVVLPGDALITDVKADKTFFRDSKTAKKTGTMPTKAIVAAAETYEEGYHAGNPGGLSAIDTDLAVGNIKKTVNIFGKVGTYEEIPTITELFFEEGLQQAGNNWYLMKEDTVPAAALKVIAAMATGDKAGADCGAKIIYNGVERAKVDWDAMPDYGALARWGGDGVGSSAIIQMWIRSSGGADNYYRTTCWYVT